MVSWVRLPFLSGFPAIFQVFLAVFTSFPHVGHFAMVIPRNNLITIIRIKHFLLIELKTSEIDAFTQPMVDLSVVFERK